MLSIVLFFVFLEVVGEGGGILEPNLLHSFTYSYILLQNGFGFLAGNKKSLQNGFVFFVEKYKFM